MNYENILELKRARNNMKKLIVFMVLMISGCGSRASMGDCYIEDGHIYKVIEIGKYGYESIDTSGSSYVSIGMNIKNQVDCFEYFNNKEKAK